MHQNFELPTLPAKTHITIVFAIENYIGKHFESPQNSPKQLRYHTFEHSQNFEADLRKSLPLYRRNAFDECRNTHRDSGAPETYSPNLLIANIPVARASHTRIVARSPFWREPHPHVTTNFLGS